MRAAGAFVAPARRREILTSARRIEAHCFSGAGRAGRPRSQPGAPFGAGVDAGGLARVGVGGEGLADAFLAGGILVGFASDGEKFSAWRRRGVIHRSQGPDDPRFAGRPAPGSDESRPYDATPNVSPAEH